MNLTFSKLTTACVYALLLTSCSQIVPTNRYDSTQQTPTVTINNFKDETQKNQLEAVISENKPPQNQEEFFLKEKDTKNITKWINYFSKSGKRGFETFLTNGEKYKPIIQKIFQKHNLPQDLYYVGLIESGYKNHARSHAGAVGPWQFIKETARRYGLKVTSSIDERKNIYKSTEAAALYFHDLYNIFGSWELALAAYNAGEYGVIRRIRGANTRDFYQLSEKKVLPRETRNYVPKVIAAIKVDNNRNSYRLKVRSNNDQRFLNVKSYQIKKSISLNKLSQDLGISKTTIKQLNHDIKGEYIPYLGRAGFEIYLPTTNISDTRLSNIVEHNSSSRVKETKTTSIKTRKIASTKSVDKQYHTVRKNESLFSISKRYNVTLRTLKEMNKLKKSTIYIGQKIYLPIQNTASIKYSYKVKKGDHLGKIANMFKIPVKRLKNLNNMSKAKIFVGQKLKVPAHKKKFHVVKPGDALLKIANLYGTSIDKLKNYNNLEKATIYPGQKILIKMVKI